MKVPGWVVVLTMMVNASGLMALKSMHPETVEFTALMSFLAALGVFLGLVKSPIAVSVSTETTTVTTTSEKPSPPEPTPLPPPPEVGK